METIVKPALFTPHEATNHIPSVYVIHENEEWVEPLFLAFEQLGTPYQSWFVNDGLLALDQIPPKGIFYNRMSASSHTRGHRYAVEYSEALISWLELHNRKVINGRQAVTLEVRKAEQYLKLKQFGITTPKTIMVNSKEHLLEATESLDQWPLIVKPNRGGKGLGVLLVASREELVRNMDAIDSIDNIFLVQEYIKNRGQQIVRIEFVAGQFLYAVRIESHGGFELCPADACEIPEKGPKFEVIGNYSNPEIQTYEKFLDSNNIQIAGIEYIETLDGKKLIYDINTNTNYNSAAEIVKFGNLRGMPAIADYLDKELRQLQ